MESTPRPAEATDSGIRAHRDGPILRLRLDRSDRRNALTGASFQALAEAFERAAEDDELRAVELSAAGEHFCAGADLEASNAPRRERPRTGHLVRGLARGAHRLIRAMHELPLPIVAGVRGYAAGVGCNLALASDFVIVSETARFVEPFVERGLTPDSGSTWLLPRLVGLARARRMLLLGEAIAGQEAADWGLVHEITPDTEMDARLLALTAQLAEAATLSLGLAKSVLHRNLETGLAGALENEAYAEELAIRSLDFKEGLQAFREKRKPTFEGR